MDYCINTFVNFGPATFEISQRVCTGRVRVHVGKNTHFCVIFTRVPGLMSIRRLATIEQVVNFIILY